jgi:opacity protein-like surface antigen
MTSPWRLLGVAAVLNMTLGAGAAAAQQVFVRNAPAGTALEVVVNAGTAVTGTANAEGEATLPFTVPEKDGKAEMDANIFVDVCDKLRRVVIVDQTRPAPPAAAGCDRREVSGLFWVRRVNTIVIDVGAAKPTLLLISGTYNPPRPDVDEQGEPIPREPLPKGFMMSGGGGLSNMSNTLTLACGNAPCTPKNSQPTYTFAVTYWLTRWLGVEGSFIKPRAFNASGGIPDSFAFDTEVDADIWTVVAKGGVPAGPMRLYIQGGMNYHQATAKTTQTMTGQSLTQTFEFQTKGWNWVAGGGAEAWIKPKIALYGELGFAKIKGDATGGGEAAIDDRARFILGGIRVRLGG